MVNRLNANQDLAVVGPLVSNDGSSKLVLQGDGNIVLYRSSGAARWASNTNNAVSAVMQADGNFVALKAGRVPVWSAGSAGPVDPAYFLVLQDDGNLVIYGPGNSPVWASNTVVIRTAVPGFLPSSSGFRFSNRKYPAVPDLTIPVLGTAIRIGDASKGLCGGMVFAARDYFEAGLPIPPDQPMPPNATSPSSGPLFDYIVRRLFDSFNLGLPLPLPLIDPIPPYGPGPLTYMHLMDPALPDHETVASQVHVAYHGRAWVMIEGTWPKVKADIDRHQLSPIALIELKSTDPTLMGNNHQVLVYGYILDATDLTLRLYDPNFPGRDDITMSLSLANPKATTDVNNSVTSPVWCFFQQVYGFSSPLIASGRMWHTLRNANGSWAPSYGLIESQERNDPGPFSAIACAGVGNSLQVAGLSLDGKMWHTIRNPDGSWQATYGMIEGQEKNDPGPFGAIACAGVTNAFHVVGLSTHGRQMWHTIRNSDGSWQATYGLVEGQETNDPGPFTAIACADVTDSLHVVGLCNSQMWHTIRHADGTWQSTYGLIESQEKNDPGPFCAVACAGVLNSLHVVGLSTDGKMWHTIRNPDGSWQATYGLIESRETNDPGPFSAVACAGVASSLHVVGLSADGMMWHTIRSPDGSWQPAYGLVESQETNNPGPFGAVACADITNSLHVVGRA